MLGKPRTLALCWLWWGLVVAGWPGLAHAAERFAFNVDAAQPVQTGCPDEVRPVRLTVRNIGTETWTPGARDRVSYHWRDPQGAMVVRDGERTLLPRSVLPGESIEVEARLRFPAAPGTYQLQWAMVREQVTWFPAAGRAATQVVVAGEPDPFAWSARVSSLPEFSSGERAGVDVTLDNLGCVTWQPERHDLLSYRWVDPTDGRVISEGLRTPLPEVAPGESVTVTATVEAPDREGSFVLQFEPVRENMTWFGPGRSVTALDVDVGPGPLRWSLVGSLPAALHEPVAARTILEAPVVLRNEGTQTWSSKTADHVSYRWLDPHGAPVGEGIRAELPRTVAPGEEVRVDLRIAVPDDPGTYRFELRPVRERVRWFGPPVGGDGATDVVVQASALEWSIVETSPPTFFWVGRTAEVEVTVRNEGSSTWSPRTSDRITYRWRDDRDEVLVSEGRRTEVTRDVAPGETITLTMPVSGPPSSGAYTLELRMVREHIAWFGPPTSPASARIEATVRWQSSVLGAGLVAIVVVLVLLRRLRTTAGWARRFDPWVWPMWLAVCVWLDAEIFSELSGVEFWGPGRIVAVSCGALAGAMLAVLGRGERWLGLGAASFVAVLTVADLAYVEFFGALVPLTALAAAHHLTDAGHSVATLVRPSFGWVLLLPASGVLLAIGIGRLSPRRGWTRWAPTIGLGAAGLPALGIIGSVMASDVGHRVFSEYRNAGRLSVAGAHLFQLARGMRALGRVDALSDADRRSVTDFYARRRAERGAVSRSTPELPMNVVLLQVEALQQWVVDARIDGEPVMPGLAEASQRGLVFDAVFDQTAQGRTSDAEYLALTSNHALAEGALSFLRADTDFVTIAHVLAQRGYTTLSAHPYRRGFWNRATLHPRYGFETSLFRRELGPGVEVGWGLADGPFLDRMAERIASIPRPFFAFLITLSLHHPYEDFPAGLRELELGPLAGTRTGNYLHAMRYFDRSLSRFLRALDDAGLSERTIVVVYGDHVTGLDEPPELLRLAGIDRWTPSTPALLHRVPVVIFSADPALRGRSMRVGGQIDLGPTVLALLGIESPGSFVGRSLLVEEDWAALPSGGAVGSDRMFVPQGQGIGEGGACFDYPGGSPRPGSDCAALVQRAQDELTASRAVLDHDLFERLDSPSTP